MTNVFRCYARIAWVLAVGARQAIKLRAVAHGILAAALLAPLAFVAPVGVPAAAAQVANWPAKASARSTSPGRSGQAHLSLNIPQSGASWTVLPNNGLNGDVSALTLCGGQLYAGGLFQQTGDGTVTNLNNIARLNLATQKWTALTHMGLDANVFALACLGTDLYVGGYFNQSFDGAVTNLHKIAKYNTTTDTWSALPHNGLEFGASDQVSVLAFSGTDLYVGGYFVQTADGAVTNLNYIAKFSTSGSAWSALAHNGLNFGVSALAFSGSDLYVGGSFAQTHDGGVTNLNKVARYSTTSNTWSAVANHGLNGNVSSLAVLGGDLYVGGLNFTKTADSAVTNLNEIAKLSTTSNTWSALPDHGLNNQVHALLFNGGDLYVGGLFTHTATLPATSAPQQVVLNGMALFPAGAACGNVAGNAALQQFTCTDGGGTMTIGATAAQFAAGDIVLNVTSIVSCAPQTITSVRVLTPDGLNPNLNGPVGATAGTFAGAVPLLGSGGPLDLKLLCSGSATPVSTVILTIVTTILAPSGGVGFGTLAVKLANANIPTAQVVLYYKDPALGDVIWNANAYNQLNPQTAAPGGQYGWSVPSGQYFIKVSAPCYQDAQSSVVPVPPAITNLNVTLTPAINCTSVFLPVVRR